MQKTQRNQRHDSSIAQLPLAELRQKWAEYWGVQPHALIGRTMLEKSLEFRMREQETGELPPDIQARLDQLVKNYRRSPKCFDENRSEIKPGTRLVRHYNGQRYSVLVQAKGYEYKGALYSSLSNIASEITGNRRNGWDFFGLKRKEGGA
jgi:hypothetical protein